MALLKRIQARIIGLFHKYTSPLLLLLKKITSFLFVYAYSLFFSSMPHHEKRDKPHILIIRNNFYAHGSDQPSTEIYHLDNSLKQSGLATFDVLTYESLHIFPFCDYQLIKKCLETKPDMIVFSSWWCLNLSHPSEAVISFINKKMKIKTLTIWWDTCSLTFINKLKPLMPLFDVHLIVDNPKQIGFDLISEHNDRLLYLWPPQDHKLYFSTDEVREIPLLFQGQVSSYRSYRKEVIDYLIEHKAPGKFLTNDRHKQVTHQEYAKGMRNSKISINFSQSVNSDQFKSRILEVMLSGSLLMESDNEQIKMHFEPMVDYVPFTSKEDLLQKINYYLDNENKRSEIAKNGQNKALSKLHSDIFWKQVIQKIKT